MSEELNAIEIAKNMGISAAKAKELAAKHGKQSLNQQVTSSNLLPFLKCEYKGGEGLQIGKMTLSSGQIQFDEIYFVLAGMFKFQEWSNYSNKEGYEVYCYAPPTKEMRDNMPYLTPKKGTTMQEPEGGLCANCKKNQWKTIDKQRIGPECASCYALIGFMLKGFDPNNPKIDGSMIQPFQMAFRRTAVSAFEKMIQKMMSGYSITNAFKIPIEDQEIEFDGRYRTIVKLKYISKENYYIPEFTFIDDVTMNEAIGLKLVEASDKLEDVYMERIQNQLEEDPTEEDIVEKV